MKGLYVFLTLVFIAGLSLFIASCFMGTRLDDYKNMIIDAKNYEEKTIVYQYNEEQIDLDFSLVSNAAKFEYADTDEITIHYFENIKRDTVTSSYSDGKLSFAVERKWYFNIIFWPIFLSEFDDMTITLPNDINFNNFKVQIASGNVTIPALTVNNKIDLLVSSGKITISDVATAGIYTDVKSGDVRINNLVTTDIIARISSGNLYMENIEATNMTVNISSGNSTIASAKIMNAEIKLSSGNLKITNSKVDNFNSINIASGNVTLDGIELLTLNAKLSSGNLKVNLSKASTHSYDLKATSGSIKINGSNKGEQYHHSGTVGTIYARLSSGKIEINY